MILIDNAGWKNAALIVANMGAAAERINRVSFRVPLRKMPPAYWVQRVFVVPTQPLRTE